MASSSKSKDNESGNGDADPDPNPLKPINTTSDENRNDGDNNADNELEQVTTGIRTIGRFKLRGKTDDLPQDWWFASTAIPLVAATIGPLANVLSIAALVTKWRVTLPDNGQLPAGTDNAGVNIPDPTWELVLNAVSLTLGFVGNFFLLLNFTRRIRYIIALPATIICWYFATGILTAIILAMNQYVPPIRPGETYSQGFWHAIIASVLYMIGSMILMVNMLGYFLGHYPQHFDLDDDQRTLILQTMMFFFWLAGGAAVFSAVCGFTYANALYFCDVTVLTVGFGDIVPTNDAGRGLVFPYAVIGIIFLGLMINSIRKFTAGMSKDKVIRKHQLNERERTFGRTVTSEKELRDRLGIPARGDSRPPAHPRTPSAAVSLERRSSLDRYGRFETHGRTVVFKEQKPQSKTSMLHVGRGGAGRTHQHRASLSHEEKAAQRRASGQGRQFRLLKRQKKLILLKEERDRFNAMRDIQEHTSRFKQYYALSMSVIAFGILWCVGAAVFMVAEARLQPMSYFESLYFCYVSLLTIGYGEFSPQSNAGKPFFIIWSLLAIPTMTILVSDMGDTVVGTVNRGTFALADWTVMPKKGKWHDFLEKYPRLRDWLFQKTKDRLEKKRVEKGFALQDPEDPNFEGLVSPEEQRARDREAEVDCADIEKLVEDEIITEHDVARRLALAIKKTANDMRADKPRRYSYEEWVVFTRLIRFRSGTNGNGGEDGDGSFGEEDDGALVWDWIGEDSPMLADVSEPEWVLDRLCESLNRYTRAQNRQAKLAKEKEGQLTQHEELDVKEEEEDDEEEDGKAHFMLTSPTFKRPSSLDGHNPHIAHYPAHPGPRSPGSPGSTASHHQLEQRGRSKSHDISPVLLRGPSGVEIVKLNSKSKRRKRNKREEGSSKSDTDDEGLTIAEAAGESRTRSRSKARQDDRLGVGDGDDGVGANR